MNSSQVGYNNRVSRVRALLGCNKDRVDDIINNNYQRKDALSFSLRKRAAWVKCTSFCQRDENEYFNAKHLKNSNS